MAARPYPLPGIRTKKEEDGSITVLIRFQRSGWQKWLGAPAEYERQYQLDSLGSEVLAACDGETSVKQTVKRFSTSHNLNIAEAELAVTKYLKTLMMKRIIGMAIE